MGKKTPIAQVGRNAPNALNHLTRTLHGVGLDGKAGIRIRDHVEEDSIRRRVLVPDSRYVMPGTQEHVVRGRSIVLAVGEEELHTSGRGLLVEHSGQLQKNRGARSAVVGTGDRLLPVGCLETLVRLRPRVPVGEEEQP